MHFKKYCFLAFFISICFSVDLAGQNFHFTNYQQGLLNINPAYTGAFNGSYRINGIFRHQYAIGQVSPFVGFSINVDAPIVRGLRKQDWVGVGLRLNSDDAGSLGFQMNTFGLSAAYHLSLDKKQTRILTLGAQYNTGGISAGQLGITDTPGSFMALSSDATAFNQRVNMDQRVEGGSLNDLNVGLLYNMRGKNGNDFKIGASAYFMNPNKGFNRQDNLGVGIQTTVELRRRTSKKLAMNYGAYFYKLRNANFLNVNAIADYRLNHKQDITLHAGLGTRSLRSVLFYAGATMNGIKAVIGYDANISAVDAFHKSIEISVGYVGRIYKRPKPTPVIFCPRL